MSIYATSIYGGGGIPVGDQFRNGTPTTLNNGSDTTILNLTTTAGRIHGIRLEWANVGGNSDTRVNNLKITVDGASERTITGTISHYRTTPGDSLAIYYTDYYTLPIIFASSITIKLRTTLVSGIAADCVATVDYSVN